MKLISDISCRIFLRHKRLRKISSFHLYTAWSIKKILKQLGAITALFNNLRTLKFKAQPTNAFSATVNQMFGGSSQLPTTAEHCFVVWTVLNYLITSRSAVVGGWKEPPNIWLTVAKNAFVGWALNFRVRMLLKGAVSRYRHFMSDLL